MASKRYDICTPRQGSDGKTYWNRIGTAWEGDKGIQLVFDALPLPDAEAGVSPTCLSRSPAMVASSASSRAATITPTTSTTTSRFESPRA